MANPAHTPEPNGDELEDPSGHVEEDIPKAIRRGAVLVIGAVAAALGVAIGASVAFLLRVLER